MYRDISPTGLVTTFTAEDGKLLVNYQQHTAPAHELAQDMRNSDEFTKAGIKADFWKIAHLTEADCLKMMVEDGINPYDCHPKELRRHLAKNKHKWGHLFTTSGKF